VEPHGAQLWFVGTDTTKDYLANRWRIGSGVGQIHFSAQLADDFYRQITAEYRVTLWKHGHRVSRWEKKQADRNEVLDLMVYNTAAAQYLGLHKLTEAHWDKLTSALNPNQISLFASAEDKASAGASSEQEEKPASPYQQSASSYEKDSEAAAKQLLAPQAFQQSRPRQRPTARPSW
jgi:phage terminase large subunit GpA-like protein